MKELLVGLKRHRKFLKDFPKGTLLGDLIRSRRMIWWNVKTSINRGFAKRFGEKLEDDEDFSSIDAYRWFGKVYVVGK
tara:strand:+ start:209 stop:442 length:234 start_codon:yes stop_codon:yes gene_type:complete